MRCPLFPVVPRPNWLASGTPLLTVGGACTGCCTALLYGSGSVCPLARYDAAGHSHAPIYNSAAVDQRQWWRPSDCGTITAVDAGGVALVGAMAGVVGALLGAGGAVTAAVVTARRQQNAQHAQWRRQVRRDAYSVFLTLVLELSEALWELEHLVAENANARHMRRRSARRTDMQEGIRATQGKFHRMNSAQATVELEGPNSVAGSSFDVRHFMQLWTAAAISRANQEDAQVFRRRRDLSPESDISAYYYAHLADDALDRFKDSARVVLGSSESSVV
ncbi:hypothetical protein QFZ55_002923 [Streptomyces luteogriseus]|nr:hypothetical protein [Streptomyces luteogriseus]